jgi:hypothetical protein
MGDEFRLLLTQHYLHALVPTYHSYKDRNAKTQHLAVSDMVGDVVLCESI